MCESPIFVVGVPRSGTTLLATILAGHSRLSGGPETHVLHWWKPDYVETVLGDAEWPRKAADFLFSIIHAERPVPENYGLTYDSLVEFMKPRPRTVRTLVESLTEQQRIRLNKMRWVEKTPDHLPHVALIRSEFPKAKIIRIVRDPRDVAHSLLQVPWGPSSFAAALCLWRKYDDASRDFFENDTDSLTVRYEDLVSSPEQEVRRICAFIGEKFEPTMLETTRAAEVVDSYKRPWLKKVHERIDQSRAGGWRHALGKSEIAAAESVLGNRLRDFRYEDEPSKFQYVKIVPESAIARGNIPIEVLGAKAYRVWRERSGERPVAVIYAADPASPQRGTMLKRTLRSAKLLTSALLQRAMIRDVYWVPDRENASRRSSVLDCALGKMMEALV